MVQLLLIPSFCYPDFATWLSEDHNTLPVVKLLPKGVGTVFFIVLILIAAAGVGLAVLGQTWLPFAAAILGVALCLFVWSMARLFQQARHKQIVCTKYILMLFVSLLLFDGLVCTVILLISGLGHSARVRSQAPLLCLMSFIVIVVLPVFSLMIYRSFQAQTPERFAPAGDGLPGEKNTIVRPTLAVVMLLTLLGGGFLLPRTSAWPPLVFAARGGHRMLVKLLLEAGADANSIDRGGYTPLTQAASKGPVVVMQLLIEHGAKE